MVALSRSSEEPADVHLPHGYGIKPGYVARDYRIYFRDDCNTVGITYQPDVYALAGTLADLLDIRTIVDLGCGTAAKLVPLARVAKTVGIDFGDNLENCRNSQPELTWLDHNLEEDVLGPSMWAIWAPSVIVCADVIEHLLDPTVLLRSIAHGLDSGGVAILSTPDRELVRGTDDYGPPANPHHVREWTAEEFERLLTAAFRVAQYGHTRNNDRDGKFTTITGIVTAPHFSGLAQTISANDFPLIRRHTPQYLLDRSVLRETTILVKTFERPYCLERLVRSIRERYPDIPILVADDSRSPCLTAGIAGVGHYSLPFDSGLAASRNALLDMVKTDYFVLCDDDFVFTEETRIEVFANLLEYHALDIVGGDLRLGTNLQTHHGQLVLEEGTLRKHKGCYQDLGTHQTCDIVLNFLGGRTATVRAFGGWDARFKLCEHAFFFLKAKGRLRVAHTPLVLAGHIQEQQPEYMEYRRRALDFFFEFGEDYGVRRLVEFDGTVFERPVRGQDINFR
jgi:SAM-dependent methyltransferase